MNAKTFKLAVLFADLSLEQYQAQANLSDQVIKIITAISLSFRGRVITVEATRVMACFPDTDDACMAAMSIQRKLFCDTGHASRLGVHSGLCLVQGSRIFGEVVDAAEALLTLTGKDEIILSAAVMDDALASVTDSTMRVETSIDQVLYRLPWKEIGSAPPDAPVDDAPVEWVSAPPAREAIDTDIDAPELAPIEAPIIEAPVEAPIEAIPDRDFVAAEPAYAPLADEVVLVLYGVDKSIDITADSGVFCVGRDAGLNDWVFGNPMVSRSHFRIEYHDGDYVLLDCSANGTYVTVEGQREVRLLQDELVLRDSGVISLAVAAGVDPELVIRFGLEEYDVL